MSPEQFIGKDVDRRSDVWSAGVTLFEILTGDCPFVADNLPSLRIKIVNGSLPELPLELPYVQELKAVLEKALSKDREARYQTAAEFGTELRSLMLKIQQADVSDPAIASPPSIHDPVISRNPDHSSERTLPPPKPLVNLGFEKEFRAPVFLVVPPKGKLWFDAYHISSLHELGGIVGAVGGLLLSVGATAMYWQPVLPVSRGLIIKVLAGIFINSDTWICKPPSLRKCPPSSSSSMPQLSAQNAHRK
jgi:serine/threonine protein kinase